MAHPSAEDRSRNDPAKPMNRNDYRHLLSSTFRFDPGMRSLPL